MNGKASYFAIQHDPQTLQKIRNKKFVFAPRLFYLSYFHTLVCLINSTTQIIVIIPRKMSAAMHNHSLFVHC